jgi:NAD(P)H dehydrogenase (quinone)
MVHIKDDRAAALEKLGADIVVGDLHQIDTIRKAMEGTDAAYFVYPVQPELIEATVNFAQAAKQAPVAALVNLSQRSANRTSVSYSCRDSWIAEQVLQLVGPARHPSSPYLLPRMAALPLAASFAPRKRASYVCPLATAAHAPIAAEDIGRVAAALLDNAAQHAGQIYPLFGPVEMNHEQIAAELTVALGRPIIFQDASIDEYCNSLEALGISEYVVQHFRSAMDDYQHGVMSGMNDNVEKLSGHKPMSVTEFAKRHLAELNRNSAT